MAITAKEVNSLRKLTGAGMMDCKKALVEAEGDIDKAIEYLRKKGQKIADKRGERDANEGAVFAMMNDDKTEAILLELNCETDFVARNEDFQKMGASISEAVFKAKATDLEAARAVKMDGKPVSEILVEAMGRIGEKIDLSKFERVNASRVITYIHPGARVGVAVAFDGVGSEDIELIGKDVAMQVAAMKPIGLTKDDVDPTVVQKELEIAKERYRQEGKPEAILDKIAQGTLNKFYKENTLLNQEFVKDTSKTVKEYLKEANPNLTIKAFKRLQLGQE